MLASLALRRSLLPVSTVTTQLAVARPVPFVFTAHYGTAKPAPPKGKPAQPAVVAKKVAPSKVVAKPPPPPPKGSRAEKIEKQKEQDRAAKEKLKEKERAAQEKLKEKEQQQKEKEKEKAHREKLKEKEQQQKEKEKERLLKEKTKEKEQQQKEKDRATKEKLNEKEKEQKEKDKAHALKEKVKEKKQEESEHKKAEKQKKDEFPSRAKSPYIYFTLEIRDKVTKEMPELKFTEVMGEMGKRWTALPDNARAKYEKLSQQDKVRFEKELAQYKIKYPDPPKRARSAYMFFVTNYSAIVRKEHPDYSVTQVVSISAQKWKSLSANEKKKYDDMATKDKERYTKERAKFDKLAANKQ